MTHKILRKSLSEELLGKSELKLTPSPSPGRPPRSSVRAPHCPTQLRTDHLDEKSAKATFGRKNCKPCPILYKKDKKHHGSAVHVTSPCAYNLIATAFKSGTHLSMISTVTDLFVV